MKVFISGGAGFIGSHLSQRLLDRGDRAEGLPDALDPERSARHAANI